MCGNSFQWQYTVYGNGDREIPVVSFVANKSYHVTCSHIMQ